MTPRLLLTLAAACLLTALGNSLPATADEETSSFLYLPPTVSPEAAAILRMMPGPGGATALPEPDDIDAWAAVQQVAEAGNLERQKPRIERLEPELSEIELGGVPVIDVRPRGWQDNGKLLVYTHGGAYTLQSAKSTLDSAGQFAKLDLYEGMVHVFQVSVPGSPESDLALSKSAEFLEVHLLRKP